MSATITKSKQPEWKAIVSKYQVPSIWMSLWQLCNSFVPFFGIWIAMYFSLDYSYWLTLLLGLAGGGFLVRIFIIQHDCGHGSFFSSKKVNDLVGLFCSLFTWTPYYYWQRGHAIHHAHTGNLEQRGIGDIYTMTVKEYLEQSKWGRLKYRLYRNPVNLFIFIPCLLFTVFYRFPTTKAKTMKKFESSIHWTNLAILILVSLMIWLIGWKAFVLVHLPVLIVSSAAGTWLFFIQHQFEDAYWADSQEWDYTQAALQGSSYYKLPKVLQWFTGNIGFHHIHHLSSRIPNYMLEKCHKENPLFWNTVVLTLRTSVKSVFLTLWDDEEKKLISFRRLNYR
jgi:omega-6 fatty acid desaturase (delta-12 desaturase)